MLADSALIIWLPIEIMSIGDKDDCELKIFHKWRKQCFGSRSRVIIRTTTNPTPKYNIESVSYIPREPDKILSGI